MCPELAPLYNPWKCPQLQGLFIHILNWACEWGVVGNSVAIAGRDSTAGPGKEYYAYCVKKL